MKKIISSSLIFLIFLTPFASADGCIHIQDPDMDLWTVHDEKQQLCAINYENGYQKMILAVDTGNIGKNQKGVWIFPVPASPDETAIDVVKEFPRLWGTTVENKLDQTISDAFSIMRLSQIYTFPLFILRSFMFGAMGSKGFEANPLGGTVDGVTVYEHIKKYGVTTELLSTENGEALHKHLTVKGLNLPEESKAVIDEYVGDNYSFVVSWFSGSDQNYDDPYRDGYYETVSVSLTFPTEKIYYPLKPTSLYGSERVPALIYVMSHVTPDLYSGIEKDSEVTYFISSYYPPTEELKSFFNGKDSIENLEYTKIKINSPSKYLTQDLWIENYAPPKIERTMSLINNKLAWGIVLFVLGSCLASMLSGMIIFRKDRPNIIKFAFLGLFNFLTLTGFGIASNLFRIDERFTKKRKTDQKPIKFTKWLKKNSIASLIISACFLFFTFYLFLFNPFYFLIYSAALFTIIFLFLSPFVWSYYNEKRIMFFMICFSVFFLLITIVSEIILRSVF